MPALRTRRSTKTSMVCFLRLVELGRVGQIAELAVDVGAHIAVLAQAIELVAEIALLVAHHRRQHGEARAFAQGQDLIDHLRDGLRGDALAALPAVDLAHARPQQAQVVVDLGDGAHAGARIAGSGPLPDGDGRRQPVDGIHVGLAPLLEELAGIGRQRLDVAALAFGVDGVEGQRGLARAGQAGDDHQLVARDLHVDILQVVLARAFDDDLVHRCKRAAGVVDPESGANTHGAQPATLPGIAPPVSDSRWP